MVVVQPSVNKLQINVLVNKPEESGTLYSESRRCIAVIKWFIDLLQ